jgi:hypothetical protein
MRDKLRSTVVALLGTENTNCMAHSASVGACSVLLPVHVLVRVLLLGTATEIFPLILAAEMIHGTVRVYERNNPFVTREDKFKIWRRRVIELGSIEARSALERA